MKLPGPFLIMPGPMPRLICKWCGKPVALRSGPVDEIQVLICSRQDCIDKRPVRCATKWKPTMLAEIMIHGTQANDKLKGRNGRKARR